MKTKQNNRTRIDLHLHSSFSDGTNTLSEVIKLADEEGMRAIAITDHNCFAITKKLIIGDCDDALEVIPGCEFSCSYHISSRKETSEVHVIGLFPFGVDTEKFVDLFSDLAEGKLNYVNAIIKKIDTLGIHVSLDEVLNSQKKEGYIGRHQLADVMIHKGYVKTVDEAFDQYIGNFSKYYVPSTKYINYADMNLVVKRILDNNGFPILCHCFDYSFNLNEISSLVKTFADASEGIGGLEVYYEKYLNDRERMEFLKELQNTYSLMPSAASDRHRNEHPFATGGDYTLYQEILRVMNNATSVVIRPSLD